MTGSDTGLGRRSANHEPFPLARDGLAPQRQKLPLTLKEDLAPLAILADADPLALGDALNS